MPESERELSMMTEEQRSLNRYTRKTLPIWVIRCDTRECAPQIAPRSVRDAAFIEETSGSVSRLDIATRSAPIEGFHPLRAFKPLLFLQYLGETVLCDLFEQFPPPSLAWMP